MGMAKNDLNPKRVEKIRAATKPSLSEFDLIHLKTNKVPEIISM